MTIPPMSAGTALGFTRPAALLYAVVRSSWAWAAVGSPACIEPPVTVPPPGPKPVTAVPGLTPRSPVTMVGPELVTVEPASTAKVAADPSGTAWPTIAFWAHDRVTGVGVTPGGGGVVPGMGLAAAA